MWMIFLQPCLGLFLSANLNKFEYRLDYNVTLRILASIIYTKSTCHYLPQLLASQHPDNNPWDGLKLDDASLQALYTEYGPFRNLHPIIFSPPFYALNPFMQTLLTGSDFYSGVIYGRQVALENRQAFTTFISQAPHLCGSMRLWIDLIREFFFPNALPRTDAMQAHPELFLTEALFLSVTGRWDRQKYKQAMLAQLRGRSVFEINMRLLLDLPSREPYFALACILRTLDYPSESWQALWHGKLLYATLSMNRSRFLSEWLDVVESYLATYDIEAIPPFLVREILMQFCMMPVLFRNFSETSVAKYIGDHFLDVVPYWLSFTRRLDLYRNHLRRFDLPDGYPDQGTAEDFILWLGSGFYRLFAYEEMPLPYPARVTNLGTCKTNRELLLALNLCAQSLFIIDGPFYVSGKHYQEEFWNGVGSLLALNVEWLGHFGIDLGDALQMSESPSRNIRSRAISFRLNLHGVMVFFPGFHYEALRYHV